MLFLSLGGRKRHNFLFNSIIASSMQKTGLFFHHCIHISHKLMDRDMLQLKRTVGTFSFKLRCDLSGIVRYYWLRELPSKQINDFFSQLARLVFECLQFPWLWYLEFAVFLSMAPTYHPWSSIFVMLTYSAAGHPDPTEPGTPPNGGVTRSGNIVNPFSNYPKRSEFNAKGG